MNRNDENIDDFWDIDMLVPKKKTAPPTRRADTEAVEITSAPPVEKNVAAEKTVVEADLTVRRNVEIGDFAGKNEQKPSEEYTLEGSLIHRVAIYKWKNRYSYYEQFCADGKRLWNILGRECPAVHFFSYVPQYSQLNESQLAFYLYWRSCVRRGEYPEADYSYILLNIFELINLSDSIDALSARQQLLDLWAAYRDDYPRLDKLLCEWICDFSLIHRLPAPDGIPQSLIAVIMHSCALKEYYFGNICSGSAEYARALLSFCSNYNYKKSKFYEPNSELYDRHIYGALRATVSEFGKNGALSGAGLQDSRIVRDAYCGALCSHRIKRKLEVEYCSFSRSHEIRFLVTDIVKYAENKLRSYISVKSRLGIYALPTDIRNCIDRYFSENLGYRKRSESIETERDYEKLYDVPKHEFSVEAARRIENESWETTYKLVEAFQSQSHSQSQSEEKTGTEAAESGNSAADAVCKDAPEKSTVVDAVCKDAAEKSTVADAEPLNAEASQKDEAQTPTQRFISETEKYAKFIRLVYERDFDGQKKFGNCETAADIINEKAADILGDIVIEESDCGYVPIEDYLDIFEEFYKKQK